MELEINGKVYKFVFGLGFLREINKDNRIQNQGIVINAGIEAIMANLLNGDIETLVNVLVAANKTESPRFGAKLFEEYVNDNDSETLFDDVVEELKKSAFTKKKALRIVKEAEKEQA